MATTPTKSQARLFAQLIAELEPSIHRAFTASVTDLTAGVNWPLLLQMLEARNVEGAIGALNISEAVWNEYSSAMTSAYAASGSAAAAQIEALGYGTIGTRFNMQNPRAQEWIRNNIALRVTEFTAEQVRVTRQVIEAGYALGQGPRNIAVDLAGRVQAGRRVGGVLGLDGPRAERLHSVAMGMRTPEGVRHLVIKHENGQLGMRYKVNKATEMRIIRAYNAGEAVPSADQLISVNQYRNGLLKARADTVASTETASAVMGARDEEWRQLTEREGLDASAVIKTWQHRRGAGGDFRPEHLAMSGKSVRGLHTPFVFPDGAVMLHSHDPAGGAKHVINCGCSTEYRLDRTGGV
jgi:hypothetical protein